MMTDGTLFAVEKKPSNGRYFVAATAGCLLSVASAPAGATGSAAERDAILEVCGSAPAAELARAERRRGDAALAEAKVLPNPSLVAEHQRTLRGASEHETVIGVSVSLGLGGRRSVLQDAAASKRDRARADAEATLFENAVAFREAYLQATVAEARLAVLTEEQAAVDGFSVKMHGLAGGGEAAGYDLLRQQAHSRRHRATLEEAKAHALSARARLGAWLEQPAKITKLSSLELAATWSGPQTVEQPLPQVRSLLAAARASDFEASAARRRWVPDLEVFGGYRTLSAGSSTGQGVSLAVSLPLTFFDHGQGEAARAEAERDVASALAVQARRSQKAEARAARIGLQGLSRALADAEKASAEMAAIKQKAEALYRAGETSVTELLEVFRMAEEGRLRTIDLMERLARTRLALIRATGTMFDPALDRACAGNARRQP
jgi:cobalt-zinc-cadmium efflux system outer membrane protein